MADVAALLLDVISDFTVTSPVQNLHVLEIFTKRVQDDSLIGSEAFYLFVLAMEMPTSRKDSLAIKATIIEELNFEVAAVKIQNKPQDLLKLLEKRIDRDLHKDCSDTA